MDVDQLNSELLNAALERAAAAGRHFGQGADQDLRNLVANAAEHLAAISDPQRQSLELEQAQADLRRLIDEAIGNARALADYPADLLGEQSYFPARMRFCPCRPFC